MNRIVERFARLKGEKAFIVYIGAGDPNLEATRQLALRWFDNFSRLKQAGTMKTATSSALRDSNRGERSIMLYSTL